MIFKMENVIQQKGIEDMRPFNGHMTFRQLYDALPNRKAVKTPKNVFIERVARATCKSTKTVRGWLAGAYRPDELSQKTLENELGISASILFPSEEVNNCM